MGMRRDDGGRTPRPRAPVTHGDADDDDEDDGNRQQWRDITYVPLHLQHIDLGAQCARTSTATLICVESAFSSTERLNARMPPTATVARAGGFDATLQ